MFSIYNSDTSTKNSHFLIQVLCQVTGNLTAIRKQNTTQILNSFFICVSLDKEFLTMNEIMANTLKHKFSEYHVLHAIEHWKIETLVQVNY